jgi:hypothetical protein
VSKIFIDKFRSPCYTLFIGGLEPTDGRGFGWE